MLIPRLNHTYLYSVRRGKRSAFKTDVPDGSGCHGLANHTWRNTGPKFGKENKNGDRRLGVYVYIAVTTMDMDAVV